MKRPIRKRTARLTLREVTDSDFDAIHAYASDPDVVRHMAWGPNSEAQTREFLERSQADAAASPRRMYELAIERSEDGLLVGTIGVHCKEDTPEVAMLGYCLDPVAWGHGYATEAATEMVRVAFEELGVLRLWAGCDPENRASVRVLEKIGMRLEGRLREACLIRGEWRDTLLYAALRHEWSMPPTPRGSE